ncbi:Voltage-dependent calcium channel gamma-1 subunit, partial [Frankliniella fusca]
MPSIKKPPPAEDVAATRAALQRQETLKKMAEERYRFEQRVLTSCTAMIVLIAVLWTVALSTDHWYELEPESGGVFLRDSRTVLRSGHTGLWRLCSEQFHPTNLTAYESITTTVG